MEKFDGRSGKAIRNFIKKIYIKGDKILNMFVKKLLKLTVFWWATREIY